MRIITDRQERQPSVTGRDHYIICKSLAYAIEIIERLPERWREQSDKKDMVILLEAICCGDPDCYRLGARSHIERRGLKVVAGHIELADPNSDDNVIHIR